MSRNKKSKNKKNNEIKTVKNIIRGGSKRPISSISKSRESLNPNEINDFVDWLAKTNDILDKIHFPKTNNNSRRLIYYSGVSLEKELKWATSIFKNYRKEINEITKAKELCELYFINGDIDRLDQLLEDMTNKYGHSIWALETKVTYKQYLESLETQKEYTNNIIEDCQEGSIPRFLLICISERCEPTTDAIVFIKEWDKRIETFTVSSELKTYLKFHVTHNRSNTKQAIQDLLRIESTSNIIDYYNTFLDLSVVAASLEDESIRSLFKNCICEISTYIDDTKIHKLNALLKNNIYDTIINTSKDVNIEGLIDQNEYNKALHTSLSKINKNPTNSFNWIDFAESASENALSIIDNSIPNKITKSLHGAITDTSIISKDMDACIKHALCLNIFSFIKPIKWYLCHEFELTDPKCDIDRIHAITHGKTHPRMREIAYNLQAIKVAPKEKQLDLHSIKLNAIYCEELDESTLNTTNYLDKYFIRALRSFRNSDYKKTITYAEKSQAKSIKDKRLIKKITSKSYAELKQTPNLLKFVVSNFIEDNSTLIYMPVSECADLIIEEQNTIGKEIESSIFANIYRNYFDEKLNDQAKYFYEDFLLHNDIDKPSDINTHNTDKKLLTYYLHKICTPLNIESTPTFHKTSEVQAERILILRKLSEIDPKNLSDYEEEIRDITRKQLINKGIRHIEETKIYVDVDAIREASRKQNEKKLERYQSLLSTTQVFNQEEIGKTLNRLRRKEPVDITELALPKNEASEIITSLIMDSLTRLSCDPEHGLDCYLSMRIRHGTLSGQLRLPFENEKIITLRDSINQEYQPNNYWLDQLALTGEKRDDFSKRLSQFSSDIDEFISSIANNLIQINSEEKQRGVFDYAPKSFAYKIWATQITTGMDYDDFFQYCTSIFWELTENNLNKMHTIIDAELKSKLVSLFSDLHKDTQEICSSSASQFSDALSRAQINATQSLSVVKSWFILPKPISEPPMQLENIIDVGLQCVKSLHPTFNPEISKEIPKLPDLYNCLTLFTDIFYIIFDNIRRHSGTLGEHTIQIKAKLIGESLFIETRNDVSPSSICDAALNKIKMTKDHIADGKYLDKLKKEGGSGLLKLKKLTRGTNEISGTLDFGFSNNEAFYVKICIPLQRYK